MLRRRSVLWLALALLVGCSDGAPARRFPLREPFASPTSSDTLVVGFVGTLSGPDAWRGEDAFEGADLGVSELNRARPEGTPPFELVQLDDGGDPGEATELVEQLSALGSIVGVIYAGPPEALPEAERALARAGVPAVLCYGDLHAAGGLSDHVFQASPPLEWQASRLASYLTRDRGYRKVGALVERSASGSAALTSLRSSLGVGAARMSAVRYSSLRSRLRPLLARLRRRRVEALVIQGGPALTSSALGTLAAMGATYRSTAGARISSAAPAVARRRRTSGWWRPQPAGLDLAVGPRLRGAPGGMVAPETYARGAHYLPVRSFVAFRRAFRSWWGSEPTGWERRAYEAARMIGWAALRARQEDDLASVLEGLQGRRFGGLPISFGSDDHVSADALTLGLWVVPRPGVAVPERARPTFGSFPWVPLARSFSHGGTVTDVLPADRAALFRPEPGPGSPTYSAMRFGVRTSPGDPVH